MPRQACRREWSRAGSEAPEASDVNLHRLRTWPLPPRLTMQQSLAAGAGILAAAVLLRLSLNHVVPGRLAFATYFPAAALAAYLTGVPGGLVVLAGGVLGSFLAWFGSTGASYLVA